MWPAKAIVRASYRLPMHRHRWLALVILCVTFCAARPAAQAECAPGTVCADYANATVVFVARVSYVSPAEDDRSLGPLIPQTVTFDVIEDFKGNAGAAASLLFDSSAPGARVFSVGETVLVYARPAAGDRSLSFAGCSRTRRIAADDPELTTLRQLRASSRGGSIEGVLQAPASAQPPAPPHNVDLGNLPLTLQPLDGAETIVVLSQPSGYFLFPWLRPGTYRLRFEAGAFVPVVRDITIAETAGCKTLDPIVVRPR
jgi:hypothetical protein